MTQGINNPSKFLTPWLHAETVAEHVFERIVSSRSGMVILPEAVWNLGWVLRSMPSWWQVFVRNGAGKHVPPDLAAKRLQEG